MNGSFFIDTNVFVYVWDKNAPDKQARSNEIIKEALLTHQGFVSYQVVQEFINVSSKKFKTPLKTADQNRFLEKVMFPLCEVHSSNDLMRDAIDLMKKMKFSFYDALIVAAAKSLECKHLLSEDFQDGLKLGSLTIVNPYQ